MKPAEGISPKMVRAAPRALVAGALCLLAQSGPGLPRDEYRAAYRSWRETDPRLELDARAVGDALSPRTEKAAAAAAAYGGARVAFLQAVAGQHAQNLQWLREAGAQSLPDLAPATDLIRFTDREIDADSASVAAFANDPDPAIQQVRQASQRELAALQELKAAIAARHTTEEEAATAAMAVEPARAEVVAQYPLLVSTLGQSADLMKQEAAVWAAYYPALAEASRMAVAPSPASISSEPSSSPNIQNPNIPSPNILSPNISSDPARAIAAPEPSSAPPRAPSITPLPLSRYVGVWGFQAGDPFHGTEPESVDVSVREENGRAIGTLYAHFKLPPKSGDDPVLRFEFSGDFRATRNQTFALVTSDGVKGTIELIPGGPFNMLEVNFETEVKPGSVHQGDMLLVKQ
jgi:hypothetical protein